MQKDIRLILIEWLYTISEDIRLWKQTYQSAVMILDKYIDHDDRQTTTNNFRIVGTTILLLASKMEEIYPLDFSSLIEINEEKITREQLRDVEQHILNSLNFNICQNTIYQHITIFYHNKTIDIDTYIFAKFVSDLLLLSRDYMDFNSNILATKIIEIYKIFKLTPSEITEKINYDAVLNYIFTTIKNIKNHLINCKNIEKFYNKFVQTTKFEIPNIPYNIIKKKNNDNGQVTEQIIVVYQQNFINNLQLNKIGYGSYSKVYKSENNQGRCIALKKITNSSNDGITQEGLREINILKNICHPSIIGIDGCFHGPDNDFGGKPTTFETYIGLELMDCTLDYYLRNNQLNVETKISYVMQLLKGVEYLHKMNIMHRDLKTHNILVSGGKLKIADFGSARYYFHPQSEIKYTQERGTVNFTPLDVCLGKQPYNHKMDIWSCACVIALIFDLSCFFCGNSQFQVIYSIFKILGTPTQIFNNDVYNWPEFSKVRDKFFIFKNSELKNFNIPDPIRNILLSMFNYIPTNRPEITTIIDKISLIIENGSLI